METSTTAFALTNAHLATEWTGLIRSHVMELNGHRHRLFADVSYMLHLQILKYKHDLISGITCPPITSLLNGAVSCGGSDFGAKCSFNCGDLYYVGGSLTTTCIDVDGDGEGDWSNQTPTCRRKRRPKIILFHGYFTS